MPTPKNCLHCQYQYCCNSAMYTKGCNYFPPESKEKQIHPLKKIFGKFFK